MKAKRLFFIIISLFFCIDSWSDEVIIFLSENSEGYHNSEKGRVKDKRSISIEPIVTYDGYTLCINSNITSEKLQVILKDINGVIIYSQVAIDPSKHHLFEIGSLIEGDYRIELFIGEDSFYGNFSI